MRQLLNVLRRATVRTDATVLGVEAVVDALAVEPRARHVVERTCTRSPAPARSDGALVDTPALNPRERRVVPYRPHVPLRLTTDDINAALRETKGSVAGAAKHLGVPRSTLRDRIRAYTAASSARAHDA